MSKILKPGGQSMRFIANVRPGKREEVDVTARNIIIECPHQELSWLQRLIAWAFQIKVNKPILIWEKRQIGIQSRKGVFAGRAEA